MTNSQPSLRGLIIYGTVLPLAVFLGYLFLTPLLRLFGATDTVLPVAHGYLSILLIGACFFAATPMAAETVAYVSSRSTALAVARYFPKGTKISAPRGGLCIWVQLDARIDSLKLFQKAIARNIAVLPGIMCATGDTFANFIRISCGMPFTDTIDQGLKSLAGIVEEML